MCASFAVVSGRRSPRLQVIVPKPMAIIEERLDPTPPVEPPPEDELEEWIASPGGGFRLARPAAKPKKPRRKREMSATSSPMAGYACAVIALAFVLGRSSLFWCGARGIPLGTLFRPAGYSLDALPDLAGRTYLVTGANSGLGFEVATQLANANANVVLACRDELRCEEAARKVSGHHVVMDLNDLKSVDAAASRLRKKLNRLDGLILNAGVAAQFPLELTVDGIERTFQANYVGHFALATRLLPLLTRTAKRTGRRSRVIHLTSGAHRGAPPEGVPLSLDAINGPMGAYARYGMAKLANLAFAAELARRAGGAVVSHAVHPGVVATNMLRVDNFAAMLGPLAGRLAWLVAQARNLLFAYSPRTAAVSVLYAAVAPEVGSLANNGQLFVPVATHWPPHHPMALDESFGARLWAFSEETVRVALRRRA